MLLLDLALENLGADLAFLLARLYDTLLGCAFAAVALVLLRLIRRWRHRGKAAPASEGEAPEGVHENVTAPADGDGDV